MMEQTSYTLSLFEARMMQIMHRIYGSSTKVARDEFWWEEIEELKRLARIPDEENE